MVQPTKGPFDHPTAGQQYKLFGFFGAQHHRQTKFEVLCNPFHQATTVATINPNLSQLLGRSCRSKRAPSRSCTLATVTTTASNKPKVSTKMCRLRPLIFLPTSKPRSPATAVHLTLWLPRQPAVGCLCRPFFHVTENATSYGGVPTFHYLTNCRNSSRPHSMPGIHGAIAAIANPSSAHMRS